PGDNRTNSAIAPLFYELTSASVDASGTTWRDIHGDTVNPGDVGQGGFMNVAQSDEQKARNFLPELSANANSRFWTKITVNGRPVKVIIAPVDWRPTASEPNPPIPGSAANPWHYVSVN